MSDMWLLTCLGALRLLGVAGLGHGEDVRDAGLLPAGAGRLLRPEVGEGARMRHQPRLAPGRDPAEAAGVGEAPRLPGP